MKKINILSIVLIAGAFLAITALGYFLVRDYASKTSYQSDKSTAEPVQHKFSTVISGEDGTVRAQISRGDSQIGFSLIGQKAEQTSDSSFTIGENVIIDYEVKKDGVEQGLKETITLKNNQAPREFGFNLELKDVKKFAQSPDRAWRFYNNSDREVFYIPAGFMIDAKGARSEDVKIIIAHNGVDYALKVTADPEWLKDSSRAYPVEIDPSIFVPADLTEVITATPPPTPTIAPSGEPQSIHIDTLLRWKPDKDGPLYQIQMITDEADFDVDPVTGEHYNRIISMVVDSPRGGRLEWGARNRAKSEQFLIGPQSNRMISVAERVTTEGLNWSFTPTHVDVQPGSVSNPSLLTTGFHATQQASDTTAAFTPTANGLLIVGWSGRSTNATVSTFTFSNDHVGSGAWSVINSQQGADPAITHEQARSQTGASPGSGTVTNTYGGQNPGRKAWIVAEVAGHDTTTPLSESNTGGAATGTSLSITLASIAAGNLEIGTLAVLDNATVTFGTNETELAVVASGGSVPITTQMQYGTDTTVDWSWTTSAKNAGVAVEYAAAAEAGGAAADPPSSTIQGGTEIRGGTQIQ